MCTASPIVIDCHRRRRRCAVIAHKYSWAYIYSALNHACELVVSSAKIGPENERATNVTHTHRHTRTTFPTLNMEIVARSITTTPCMGGGGGGNAALESAYRLVARRKVIDAVVRAPV